MCDDTKSSCDFTRPLSSKEKAGYPGIINAQYSLTGMPYIKGARLKHEVIGTGFDYRTVLRVQGALSKLVDKFYPGDHFFNCPSFGMELRLPSYVRNGAAQVGDLILHTFSTTYVTRSGCKTRVDTHIVGQAIDVDGPKGISVIDRTGFVAGIRKPYFVFPADQFDLKAALDDLQKRDSLFLEEGYFGSPHGSYVSADQLGHAMRQHLRPVARVLPSRETVNRIMGHAVEFELLVEPTPIFAFCDTVQLNPSTLQKETRT